MRWNLSKVLSLFLAGVLICTLYTRLNSPAAMINRAEDSVVVLKIVKKVVVNPGPQLPTKPSKHKKHKTIDVQLIKEERAFLCSGYIADDYGHVVTAGHCVAGGKDIVSITVYLHKDSAEYPAKVVLVKPLLDIALLKADLPKGLPYLVTVKENEPQGAHSYAIGHPLFLLYTVTEGIVSNYMKGEYGIMWLQGTAPILPGNSGGPLIDDRGRVLGVCSFMIISPWNVPGAGLGFWVPATTINTVLFDYLNHN